MTRPRRPRRLRYLWQQYATAALVLLALMGGLFWGMTIGREMGQPPAAAPQPVGTQPAAEAAPVVPAPTNTPVATIQLYAIPNASPEAKPSLTLALNIVDSKTGQPVNGATIHAGGLLVAQGASQLNVVIQTAGPGVKWVNLRIEAPGYAAWERDIRFKILHTRREPLQIELEPLLPRQEGSGA